MSFLCELIEHVACIQPVNHLDKNGQYKAFQSAYKQLHHCNDVIMGTIASQITSLTIVYSIVYSDTDQRKHQTSASLAFVRGIHPGPVNSPHKWPVTRKMFPFDDVMIVPKQHYVTYRRAANPPKVPYLRSLIHPPTHLVCNAHLIANFLSFHMNLVVVMNCGAGNVLHSFKISVF